VLAAVALAASNWLAALRAWATLEALLADS
jgi:hypothetical protein